MTHFQVWALLLFSEVYGQDYALIICFDVLYSYEQGIKVMDRINCCCSSDEVCILRSSVFIE